MIDETSISEIEIVIVFTKIEKGLEHRDEKAKKISFSTELRRKIFLHQRFIRTASRWHVDQLEFKGRNQTERFLFYDRSLRRLPSPSEAQD